MAKPSSSVPSPRACAWFAEGTSEKGSARGDQAHRRVCAPQIHLHDCTLHETRTPSAECHSSRDENSLRDSRETPSASSATQEWPVPLCRRSLQTRQRKPRGGLRHQDGAEASRNGNARLCFCGGHSGLGSLWALFQASGEAQEESTSLHNFVSKSEGSLTWNAGKDCPHISGAQKLWSLEALPEKDVVPFAR